MNNEALSKLKEGVSVFNQWRRIDLNSSNLSGLDLRNIDLSGTDLICANLSGADLRDAKLSDADISGGNLSGANLCYADLRGADLSGANLSRTNLRDIDLRDANLADANLSNAEMKGADLRGAYLNGCNLRDADLSSADLSDAILSDADLRGADLSNADLTNADITNANLANADLTNADLTNADLTEAYLISDEGDDDSLNSEEYEWNYVNDHNHTDNEVDNKVITTTINQEQVSYTKSSKINKVSPCGLRGWLILIGAGLFLSTIGHVVVLYQHYLPIFQDGTWEKFTSPSSDMYKPLWGPLLIGETAGVFVFMVCGIILILMFFTHSRRFPTFYIVVAVANLLFLFVSAWIMSLLTEGTSEPDHNTIRGLVQSFIHVVIWVPYIHLSKRVRNTFTE